MKRRTHNWDAEFDMINGRGTNPQQELVDAFSAALSGETRLTGEDSGWLMIGGIKLGTTIVIKNEAGTPLFKLSIQALPGVEQDFDPHGCYPVLLKRGENSGVERVSIDFTKEMDFGSLSNQNLDKFVKLGLMKPKTK